MGIMPWMFHREISLEKPRISNDAVAQGLFLGTCRSRKYSEARSKVSRNKTSISSCGLIK